MYCIGAYLISPKILYSIWQKDLQMFFNSRNKSDILSQESAYKGMENVPPIDNKTRQDIVRTVVDYIIEQFGTKPTYAQKNMTAKAAILAFPRLTFRKSGGEGTVSSKKRGHFFRIQYSGIVLIKELLLKGDGGWINSRLKNIREAKKKFELNKINSNIPSAARPIIEQMSELSNADAHNELKLLKTMVVEPQNMATIIEKLNLTRTYRHKILLDKELNLKEWFPFFFTHPQLVRHTEI